MTHSLSVGDRLGQGHGLVVKLFVLVHPDFGCPPGVLGEDLACASGEGVRVLVPEDMAHPRAGDYLQPATALPDPE